MLYSRGGLGNEHHRIPARDMAAKTRAAIPIIPFIPGRGAEASPCCWVEDTLSQRIIIVATGRAPISTFTARGLPAHFNQTGIWNWAIGVMVRGRGLWRRSKRFTSLHGRTSISAARRPAPDAVCRYTPSTSVQISQQSARKQAASTAAE